MVELLFDIEYYEREIFISTRSASLTDILTLSPKGFHGLSRGFNPGEIVARRACFARDTKDND
jgi:hypothetical protein